jgi:hypothetical protein
MAALVAPDEVDGEAVVEQVAAAEEGTAKNFLTGRWHFEKKKLLFFDAAPKSADDPRADPDNSPI